MLNNKWLQVNKELNDLNNWMTENQGKVNDCEYE